MNRRNKKSLQKSISKKSFIKTLMILFITFSLIYLSILIKRIDIPVILPVEKIHVLGELKFINADSIKAKVKANIVGGYFTVDMNLIREVLMQEPWIKTVTLRRQWPASLNVSVEERTPIAYWNKDAYLSESGEAFTPESIDPELNLPVLNGPQGRHETVWHFMNVLYQEMERLDYEVVRLDLDQRRAWQLIISSKGISGNVIASKNTLVVADDENGGELELNERLNDRLTKQERVKHIINVRLGRFDTEKRLHRFIRILPALINEQRSVVNTAEIQQDSEFSKALTKIKTIDMRYPNGFAVQRIVDTKSAGSISPVVSRMTLPATSSVLSGGRA